MAENELEVRLNKKIAGLQKQVDLLSAYIKRVHGEVTHPSTLSRIINHQTTVSDGRYAPANRGVTNGDGHDHIGGDGAQIDHGGLAGLADDDHTQYVKHSLATALSDFLVASGAGAFIKKSLADVKTLIGITDAATIDPGMKISILWADDGSIEVVYAYADGWIEVVGGIEVDGGIYSYDDLQVLTAGKGVVLINAAGTVTKRVRLNDVGDGLIFEAP